MVRMIGIKIAEAAFEAIKATMPLGGSVGFENEVNVKGERTIWLAPRSLARTRPPRCSR
jgi:hypothetical protein